MVQHPQNYFHLGELLVSPSHNEMMLADKRITLQPKVMAVLDYLARNRDRVVSGEELLTELWPGRVVTPGSVQKSINSLRKAFNELCGDQEMIVHYSKRGYQLVLTPVFPDGDFTPETADVIPSIQATEPDGQKEFQDTQKQIPSPSVEVTSSVVPRRNKRPMALALVVVLLVAGIGFALYKPSSNSNEAPLNSVETKLPDEKSHQTRFESFKEFINNQSREGKIQPHPDNRHLAYVRQTLHSSNPWEIDSQLMIKQFPGEDWQIANSPGDWEFVVWSPDGRYLVAVERWREEAEFPTQGFYELDSYLYTFHIFELDLNKHRLLEKYLLSQWQGRIKSVTWADEKNLEFVATQGLSANSGRYGYSILDQDLVELETPGSGRPVMSQIAKGFTALVMKDKQEYRIDLLDQKQQVRRSWQLEEPNIEISWLPDATGVMVYGLQESKSYLLYWDGTRQDLDLPHSPSHKLLSPVYRPDGKGIFYTLEKLQEFVEWTRPSSVTNKMEFAKDLLVFSPDALRLAYSVNQNGQDRIVLQSTAEPTEQILIELNQLPNQLAWFTDGQGIVYKTGRQIIFYSLATAQQEKLSLESSLIDPLAYQPETETLIMFKTSGEARNLWSLNRKTLEQKQLTFGALAGSTVANGKIYFQYRGKSGLWSLGLTEKEPQPVSQQLPTNSKLLRADDKGIYFVTGGYCRESAVQYLEFASQQARVAFPRQDSSWVTYDFHPQLGLLQTACRLNPSYIMRAE
jgi:DNA-binding winged helix-turn-helix (wHTH) protein/Tol biopolymer transport system component